MSKNQNGHNSASQEQQAEQVLTAQEAMSAIESVNSGDAVAGPAENSQIGKTKSRPKLPSWMSSDNSVSLAAAANAAKGNPEAHAASAPASVPVNSISGITAEPVSADNGLRSEDKSHFSGSAVGEATELNAASAPLPRQLPKNGLAEATPSALALNSLPAKDDTSTAEASAGTPDSAGASVEAAPAAPSVPSGDDGFVLLGAPCMADDDGAADDLLAPTLITESNNNESHPLACIVGGFAAPLHLEGEDAESSAASDQGKPSAAQPANAAPSATQSDAHETKKMQTELEQLSNIVNAVDSLEYMKPRLRKLELAGYQASDLVGLYRMAAQVLLENWQKQQQANIQMRDRYEKRLRDVVLDKSSEFMQMVTSGQMPLRSDAEAEGGAAHEAGSFMLRKQLEIKEELLVKTRESLAEAEARYDKVAQDVINIRQRQAKDVAIHLQKARESLFNKLLPILDSFDSALSASSSFVDVASVVEGLSNIHKQLLDACMTEGLQPIEAKGQLFNPNLHQAMGQVPTDEVPEDYVVTDLRRGYLLNDKLLRATMVQVACPVK
ncbi:MAG: nucleotide exchange factor GrpE [bacterium]|nr:nucleotide exchange factor GrpE [bacterium]